MTAYGASPAPYLDIDPLQIVSNPVGWFLGWAIPAVFGHAHNPLDNLMKGLINGLDLGSTMQLPVDCTSGGQDGCVWWSVWSDLHIVFAPLLGLVLALRALHVLFESKHGGVPMRLLVDTAVRGLTAVAALQVSYPLIATLLGFSVRLGNDLLTSIVAAGIGPAARDTALNTMLTAMQGQDLWAVLLIAFAVWVGALVMASRIALLFCFISAPLIIPLFVYSTRQEIAQWWMRMLVQGLLTPIVTGICLGMTLVVVFKTTGTPSLLIGGPLASLMAILCLGFTGKAIKGCIGHLFMGQHSLLASTELAMGAAFLTPIRYWTAFNSVMASGAAAAHSAVDSVQAAQSAEAAAMAARAAAETATWTAQSGALPSTPARGVDPAWDRARDDAWTTETGSQVLRALAEPVLRQEEQALGRPLTAVEQEARLETAARGNPDYAHWEQRLWAAHLGQQVDIMRQPKVA